MPDNNTNVSIVAPEILAPSELLGIFASYLAVHAENRKVLCLRGVYLRADRIYNGVAYDHLRDEKGVDQLTIVMPVGLREGLSNGNLITVYGILNRYVNHSNGSIRIQLDVSRRELVKEVTISEDEMKRAELRRVKEAKGYKNVDSVLENILFVDKRPKVALVYADASITDADFNKGLAAAKAQIDFVENRVSFADTQALCDLLRELDGSGYDIIAIVRGGGAGLERLDELPIVETLANLNTPWIYGVGHEEDNPFIKNVADKIEPIPFALGTYFRDMVEKVAQKRNNSRAVLIAEVRKQYEKQIEDSNKKNKELNKQLEAINKANKERTEASNKKIEALTKSNVAIQKLMKEQTDASNKKIEALVKANKEQMDLVQKANATSQKQLNEQISAGKKQNETLQNQLKAQNETLQKMQNQQKEQQENFNKSLGQMQETNKKLQESLSKLNAQNTQATKELADAKMRATELENQLKEAKKGCAMPGCMGVILLLIAVSSVLCAIVF